MEEFGERACKKSIKIEEKAWFYKDYSFLCCGFDVFCQLHLHTISTTRSNKLQNYNRINP
jgi:hypothetical protein